MSHNDDLIQETHDAVIRVESRMDDVNKRLEDHHKTLYGNGTPGLKATVQSNTEQLRTYSRVIWVSASFAICGILGFLGTAFLFYVRVAPVPHP